MNSKTILLAGLIIVLVEFGVWFWLNSSNDTIQPATGTDTDTEETAEDLGEWKTYRSDEYGFEFQYSANDWQLSKEGRRIILKTDDGEISISHASTLAHGLGPRECEAVEVEINTATTTGSKCFWDAAIVKNMEEAELNTPVYDIHIYNEAQNREYEFIFAPSNPRMAERLYPDFKEILSSFRFDEQSTSTVRRKTYRNEEWGFEFQYPAKFSVEEFTPKDTPIEDIPEMYREQHKYNEPISTLFSVGLHTSSTPQNTKDISVAVRKSNGMNIQEWIDYINTGVRQGTMYEGGMISNIHQTQLEEIGEVTVGNAGCCMACSVNYFIPKNDVIYKISLSGFVDPLDEHSSTTREINGCVSYNVDGFEVVTESFIFID